ncbi:hypothetical protein BDQ17DRAFT_1351791 [Cyathus striatus]|nr:hypothetical protein BDQ17DRAFT_1351791 [Cyathus striatus]
MTRQRKKPPQPTHEKPLIDISEEEQWRLIDRSGILKSVDNPSSDSFGPVKEELTLGEEIFNSLVLIIPFTSILLLMDILIHHQYGQHVSFQSLMGRMIPSTPILSAFIFYTTRYKQYRSMQFLLFALSCLVSTRMIYQVNRASWLINMRQCPPLATLWIYTIVQLDLGPAVLSLLTTWSFVWWKGLKYSF